MTSEFTHVDCFSGVGGFCTGLHAAGFTTKVAIEKVASCVETYLANHPEVHVVNNDITKVTASDILPYCPQEGVDLVTSGMPCETFSTAGNTSRSFYDDRQFLFREGIRIAQITNAKFLLFENVPGITSKTAAKGGKKLIIDILKEEIIAAGYDNFIEVVLDAKKFGVPQNRKRYFILATRLKGKTLRKPSSRLGRVFSVGDALEGLPEVVPNSWQEGRAYVPSSGQYVQLMRNESFWRIGKGLTEEVSYHMPMKHRPATLERFSMLREGESLKDLFSRFCGDELKALQARHVIPNKIFIKRNYRLQSTSPSPTVTSHCLDEFVHPTENRALTVRECARLQSFPDSYDFKGGPYIVPHINREVQDKYEQIGDAVPPLLAYAWGKNILRMLLEDKDEH
ncbi:MAG: DNA cytosine methyltransferase [Kiritimatiellae bacterium]|nr:DNA cytosine methyltransferase [Kiritimatiellia bacterium]